jgi:probable F420-dependent oxidoreductase
MKFALAFASSIGYDPQSSLELCKHAENLGFESVWGAEHVIRPSHITSPYPYTRDGAMPGEAETPIPDPLIWLAYVAAAAPSLKLGTCILILPQRNPVILAKELATLDHLSGGRVELGIGVGWLKEEFEALGVEWNHRGTRTDEYLQAMRALWAGPHAQFSGKYVDFPAVTCNPRPVNGSIPIVVGGDSPAAVRRAARHADGYYPGAHKPEKLRQLIKDLADAAQEADRAAEEIAVHAGFGPYIFDPEQGVAIFEELGVKRAMVPAFAFASQGGLERMEEFASKAIRK